MSYHNNSRLCRNIINQQVHSHGAYCDVAVWIWHGTRLYEKLWHTPPSSWTPLAYMQSVQHSAVTRGQVGHLLRTRRFRGSQIVEMEETVFHRSAKVQVGPKKLPNQIFRNVKVFAAVQEVSKKRCSCFVFFAMAVNRKTMAWSAQIESHTRSAS